jgi:hypothetical protein
MNQSTTKESLLTQLPGWFFYLLAFAITLYGWLQQSEWVHIAEEGFGYALGIIGGLMLLFQAVYPLRKRINVLKQLGTTRFWFSSHIASGVIAPIVLLFHCNFQLGSLNSQVALFSMLAVALSGLLGKYLYVRIHYGLHGRLKKFNQLRDNWQKYNSHLTDNEALETRLNHFERPILNSVYHPISAVFRLFLLPLQGHILYLQARNMMVNNPSHADRSDPSYKQTLKMQRTLLKYRIKAACELAEFSGYERLFALWHVVHIPFFFIMLAAGIAHVTAVHLY